MTKLSDLEADIARAQSVERAGGELANRVLMPQEALAVIGALRVACEALKEARDGAASGCNNMDVADAVDDALREVSALVDVDERREDRGERDGTV